MAKNLEQVIVDDLKDMLNEGETFEYVLLGKVAPDTKRLGFLFGGWTFLFLLFYMEFIAFNWGALLIILIALVLTVNFFYETVYLAKHGKRLYMHRFDPFKFHSQKDSTLFRDISIVPDRCSDFHTTIAVNFEGVGKFVILRRSYESKGVWKQSTNMLKLTADITKKNKR